MRILGRLADLVTRRKEIQNAEGRLRHSIIRLLFMADQIPSEDVHLVSGIVKEAKDAADSRLKKETERRFGTMKTTATVAILILPFLFLGCSKNTVYDSDRELQNQNQEAAQIISDDSTKIGVAIDHALPVLSASSDPTAIQAATELQAAKLSVTEVSQAALDVGRNSKQELDNWGPPKAPKNYTPGNSDDARKKSNQEHTTPWYKHWIAVALYGAGGLLTLLKIAVNFYPALGTFLSGPMGKLAQSLLQMAVNVGHKADANQDDKIHLSDVASEFQGVVAANPGLKDFIQKEAGKLHAQGVVSRLLGTPYTPPPSPVPGSGSVLPPGGAKPV